MFRSQQRKRKILFGLSDVALTAAAFELAYSFRRWLPLSHEFFLSQEVKVLLLAFSVVAWVASGYWLNIYGRLDAARVGVIVRDSARQVAYGALGLFVFIVFGLRLEYQLSRPFLISFLFLSWFLNCGVSCGLAESAAGFEP